MLSNRGCCLWDHVQYLHALFSVNHLCKGMQCEICVEKVEELGQTQPVSQSALYRI